MLPSFNKNIKLVSYSPPFRLRGSKLLLIYDLKIDKTELHQILTQKPELRKATVWILHSKEDQTFAVISFTRRRIDTRNADLLTLPSPHDPLRPQIFYIDARKLKAWKRVLEFVTSDDKSNKEVLKELALYEPQPLKEAKSMMNLHINLTQEWQFKVNEFLQKDLPSEGPALILNIYCNIHHPSIPEFINFTRAHCPADVLVLASPNPFGPVKKQIQAARDEWWTGKSAIIELTSKDLEQNWSQTAKFLNAFRHGSICGTRPRSLVVISTSAISSTGIGTQGIRTVNINQHGLLSVEDPPKANLFDEIFGEDAQAPELKLDLPFPLPQLEY